MPDNDTDRIAEIHTRTQNASSGPWGRYSVDFRGHRSHSVKTATGVVVAFTGYGPDGGTAHQDAEFIANARFYVPWLLDQLEQARAELATVRATRKHVRAERDRLKTDLAAAEEARQAWAKTAQEQLAEVKAERDRLAAAIQRVRNELDVQYRGPEPKDAEAVGYGKALDYIRAALDGEVPDGN